MEEVKFTFTTDEVRRLSDACYNGELLTLTGVNGYGERFETSGRIAKEKDGFPAVNHEAILMEFGKKVSEEKDKYTCPFEVNIRGSYDPIAHFHIESITGEKGEKIYQNDNFQKIEEKAKYFLENAKKEGYYTAHLIEKLDPVSEKLKEMVGKPIILSSRSSDRVVFCGLNGVTPRGETTITVRDEFFISSTFVFANDILSTMDNEGNIQELASNKVPEIEEIYDNKKKLYYQLKEEEKE